MEALQALAIIALGWLWFEILGQINHYILTKRKCKKCGCQLWSHWYGKCELCGKQCNDFFIKHPWAKRLL